MQRTACPKYAQIGLSQKRGPPANVTRLEISEWNCAYDV
jgi:hypothetical protein